MKSNWNISHVCAQKLLGLEVILVYRLSDEGYTRNYGQFSGSWLLLCWNCKVCMVMIISFLVSGIDYLWNKVIYSQGEHAMKFILRVFLEHQGRRPWLIGLLPNLLVLAVPSSSGCMKFRHAHLLLSLIPWVIPQPWPCVGCWAIQLCTPQSGHFHHLNSPSW